LEQVVLVVYLAQTLVALMAQIQF
jgi:hypothetical protein